MADIAALRSAILLNLAEGGSLGTPGITYISIPDTDINCAGLPLPAGSWRCSSPDNLQRTNGTGWIPINFDILPMGSPLSVLPIDPVNSVSTSYYTYSTDGAGFVITAVPESARFANDPRALSAFVASGGSGRLIGGNFPAGWAFVPGNPEFGTPGFWVMKYEAKCISGTTPLTSPATANDTYNNTAQPCTGAFYIASTPGGFPIANISHTTALAYCQAIGARLITNDEWMTIARNAEQVAANWTGGAVGSGAMFSGHNDNAPARALIASPNDADGYFGTGNSAPSGQRRTLTLSNGSVIWDMPGNVWEHVQRSVNNAGNITTPMALPTCSNNVAGWTWCEYAAPGTPHITGWTTDVMRDRVGPSNPAWHASQGIGRVRTWGTGGSQGTTALVRGESWGGGTHTGVFTLYTNWGTGSANFRVGFRCTR